MKHKIVSETPLSLVEVKALLQASKKKRELSFRAEKTFEHLQQATKLSMKQADEIITKIEELNIPRMREQYVKKLVDTLPKTDKDAKLILSAFNVSFSTDHLKALAAITKEYVITA
jgi:DNA-directed RNA polymerase subunit F